MAALLCDASRSALLVIDVQPTFMMGMVGTERMVWRSAFLVEIAHLLEVPVLASVQYKTRMGGTHETLAALLGTDEIDKMSFGAMGEPAFAGRFRALGRSQAVLVGMETHICVNQTAHQLLGEGYEVIVCEDAVTARTEDRHRIGLERMRRAGVVVAHSESVAYEWLRAADHPRFKAALELVKKYA